jgi:hypothetical protein
MPQIETPAISDRGCDEFAGSVQKLAFNAQLFAA